MLLGRWLQHSAAIVFAPERQVGRPAVAVRGVAFFLQGPLAKRAAVRDDLLNAWTGPAESIGTSCPRGLERVVECDVRDGFLQGDREPEQPERITDPVPGPPGFPCTADQDHDFLMTRPLAGTRGAVLGDQCTRTRADQ
jgi:hypothetical protein